MNRHSPIVYLRSPLACSLARRSFARSQRAARPSTFTDLGTVSARSYVTARARLARRPAGGQRSCPLYRQNLPRKVSQKVSRENPAALHPRAQSSAKNVTCHAKQVALPSVSLVSLQAFRLVALKIPTATLKLLPQVCQTLPFAIFIKVSPEGPTICGPFPDCLGRCAGAVV